MLQKYKEAGMLSKSGSKTAQPFWKQIQHAVTRTFKVFITFGSVILLLGIYPKEVIRKTIKDLFTRIFELILGEKKE